MATAVVTVREVEGSLVVPTPQQIDGGNQQHRLQAMAELTCGTVSDEDDDDDDFDGAAVFRTDTCDLGGVGP
jgi:hypothetical protein